MSQYAAGEGVAQGVAERLEGLVGELVQRLDERLDKRLVRTFVDSLLGILKMRQSGLLLSELGGYILGPEHAPAGTKRVSNLLRSGKWGHEVIRQHVWEQADQRVTELERATQPVLVVWDESVWEKAGRQKLEGLGLVRSAQADRLIRSRVGNFKTTGGKAIVVPGLHWVTLLVLGLRGAPRLVGMEWWTAQGALARSRAEVLTEWLQHCAQQWGKRVVHIWDRGLASQGWVAQALAWGVCFVVRWRADFPLQDGKGRRAAWRIPHGKRSLDHRLIWDSRRRCYRKTGLYFCQVQLPDHPALLWLVVSRPGAPSKPWYLLTNQPITSLDQAWAIVFAYARRWQVEMSYRFTKSELAMQSPRLWFVRNRLKLLFMVSLVYAFLLSLLTDPLLAQLLRLGCHRTGKRCRDTPTPLYRLRAAIARLCLAHPPSFTYSW